MTSNLLLLAGQIVAASVVVSLIIGVIYRLVKGAFSCLAMAITAVIVSAAIIALLVYAGIL